MKILLASNSPRRRELLTELGIPFEIPAMVDVDESCPDTVPAMQRAQYVAKKKAEAYTVGPDELLITADTTVVAGDSVLGKPADRDEAIAMLTLLSGRTHHVVTGVCLRNHTGIRAFSEVTAVTFRNLTADDIAYYVDNCKPYDKAGAYGIQEWIGLAAVDAVCGCYTNVVGLPTSRLCAELQQLLGDDFGFWRRSR